MQSLSGMGEPGGAAEGAEPLSKYFERETPADHLSDCYTMLHTHTRNTHRIDLVTNEQ